MTNLLILSTLVLQLATPLPNGLMVDEVKKSSLPINSDLESKQDHYIEQQYRAQMESHELNNMDNKWQFRKLSKENFKVGEIAINAEQTKNLVINPYYRLNENLE